MTSESILKSFDENLKQIISETAAAEAENMSKLKSLEKQLAKTRENLAKENGVLDKLQNDYSRMTSEVVEKIISETETLKPPRSLLDSGEMPVLAFMEKTNQVEAERARRMAEHRKALSTLIETIRRKRVAIWKIEAEIASMEFDQAHFLTAPAMTRLNQLRTHVASMERVLTPAVGATATFQFEQKKKLDEMVSESEGRGLSTSIIFDNLTFEDVKRLATDPRIPETSFSDLDKVISEIAKVQKPGKTFFIRFAPGRFGQTASFTWMERLGVGPITTGGQAPKEATLSAHTMKGKK